MIALNDDLQANPITQSTSDDSDDIAISSVTCNFGKKCYDVHRAALLGHTQELLHAGN